MTPMLRRSDFVLVAVWALSARGLVGADTPRPGYQPSVKVSAETRLDWMFAPANQSPKQAPKGWIDGYDSTKTTYELFVPRGLEARKPAAAILFISPGDKAMGYASWQQACQELGVVLVGPNAAGNDCPMQRRV